MVTHARRLRTRWFQNCASLGARFCRDRLFEMDQQCPLAKRVTTENSESGEKSRVLGRVNVSVAGMLKHVHSIVAAIATHAYG
jgi:hypothetical protein